MNMFFNFLLEKKNWEKMTKNEKENFNKCLDPLREQKVKTQVCSQVVKSLQLDPKRHRLADMLLSVATKHRRKVQLQFISEGATS